MASESTEVANQALRAAEMGGGGGGGGAVAKSKSPVPTSSKTTEEEDNERPDVYDRTTRTKIDIEAFKKSVEKRMRKLFFFGFDFNSHEIMFCFKLAFTPLKKAPKTFTNYGIFISIMQLQGEVFHIANNLLIYCGFILLIQFRLHYLFPAPFAPILP